MSLHSYGLLVHSRPRSTTQSCPEALQAAGLPSPQSRFCPISGLSLASIFLQSPPDQGEAKTAQANPPAKMLPPKQPMYAMPGLASFLTPSDLQAFRTGASPASLARTLGSKALLPGLSTSPPPPSFPLSPSLHQQLPLPPHAQGALLSPPLSMSPAPQPAVLPASMALQVQLAMSPSPPGPQVSRTKQQPPVPLTKREGSWGRGAIYWPGHSPAVQHQP